MGNKKTDKRTAGRKRAAAQDAATGGAGRVRASKSIRRRIPKVNEKRDRRTNT
jgi:hypothetical protein